MRALEFHEETPSGVNTPVSYVLVETDKGVANLKAAGQTLSGQNAKQWAERDGWAQERLDLIDQLREAWQIMDRVGDRLVKLERHYRGITPTKKQRNKR